MSESPPASVVSSPREEGRGSARLILLVAGIAMAFLLSEGVTEIWYRWHEVRAEKYPRWSFAWPDKVAPDSGTPIRDFQEFPVAGQEVLHFDRGRAASWLDAKSRRWIVTVIEWNPGAKVSAMDSRHNPMICLPSVGLELVRELGAFAVSTPAGKIPVRGYEFRRGDARPYVFSAAVRPLDLAEPRQRSGKWDRRITQFERAAFGNRQSPERILLIAVEGPRSEAEAELALREALPQWVRPEAK